MISGLAPLNGLDIRSYIPDPIQPLILLSYPITMAGELVESGMGARNGGSVPAHWAEAVDSGLGSPSSILSPASTPSALRKTVAKLLQEVPLLDKVFTSTWLDAGSSSAVDTASNHLTRAYGKGPKDALFVLFCAIAWTLLREATMRYAFQPLMRQRLNQLDARSKKDESEKSVKAGGGEKQTASWKREMRLREKTITRFAEQGWAFSYCVTFFSLGICVLLQSNEWPFSSAYLWRDYPNTPLSRLTKFYYLAQLGFWCHQLFVINVEERRKDHWQMYTHHCITILLVVGSYWTNFTRVGGVIMVLMDFCDILLPLAKMFRYFRLPAATVDATFVIFLLSWLVTRQIGFFAIFLSCLLRGPWDLPWGWIPSEGRYVNYYTTTTFQALLAALLVMSCIWFYMACNVAYRVLRGLGAADSRSDDEMEDAISDDDKPTIATVSPNGIMQLQSCCSQGDSTPEYSPTGSDVVGQSVRKRR
ncbi:Sphingosine N-acyltransferase lag1 [Naganishia albida]|nr:Sphingosine N-acyltransferase lag1 [Naganishia albida]